MPTEQSGHACTPAESSPGPIAYWCPSQLVPGDASSDSWTACLATWSALCSNLCRGGRRAGRDAHMLVRLAAMLGAALPDAAGDDGRGTRTVGCARGAPVRGAGACRPHTAAASITPLAAETAQLGCTLRGAPTTRSVARVWSRARMRSLGCSRRCDRLQHEL